MSLFKLYNLRVGVGRKLGGDLWGQAASWGPLSIEGFLGPEAELPVFGNVQTEKGCSSRRDPALKRVFCTEVVAGWETPMVSGFYTHFLYYYYFCRAA